jgi:hypothetical protein
MYGCTQLCLSKCLLRDSSSWSISIECLLTRVIIFLLHVYCDPMHEQIALADENKDGKPDTIQDKSSLDDDDLLKQESNQDLSEHKQLYQQLHQVRQLSSSRASDERTNGAAFLSCRCAAPRSACAHRAPVAATDKCALRARRSRRGTLIHQLVY